jgi:hypothetical protein
MKFNQMSLLVSTKWLQVRAVEYYSCLAVLTFLTRHLVIHYIVTERRWVLSGTPTVGNVDADECNLECLDQLQRLMIFLRHESYGIIPSNKDAAITYNFGGSGKGNTKGDNKKQAKSAWDTNVKVPFLAKCESGRNELLKELNKVMVMHKKEDLYLPTPIFKFADVNLYIP